MAEARAPARTAQRLLNLIRSHSDFLPANRPDEAVVPEVHDGNHEGDGPEGIDAGVGGFHPEAVHPDDAQKPAERERLVESGLKRAEEFSMARLAQLYLGRYERLAAGAPR